MFLSSSRLVEGEMAHHLRDWNIHKINCGATMILIEIISINLAAELPGHITDQAVLYRALALCVHQNLNFLFSNFNWSAKPRARAR